jgi:uncharacterized lipoprotein YmbA
MSRKLLIILVLLGLIAACGSTPPSNFYMLSADAPGIPGTSGPAIGVGPVSVPEYLRRSQMVLNRDSHRLILAEYDRWAEPLQDGIQRVLAINLSSLLDTQNVQIYPWRRDDPPRFGVQVAVAQFSITDGRALLIAEWTVTDVADRSTVTQRIGNYREDVGSDEPERVAAAYSALLLQLSDDIAVAIHDHG